jgi:type I restriction enzyme S subunit
MRPYLRAANVTWDGLDLGDVKEMNFTEDESAIYELRDGDVLAAEASGSADEVGRPALWRGEIDGCCFQNTLVRVRSRGVLPEYLRHFLFAEARSGRIGRASPGVGIHHIGSARLSAWPAPVPPLPEQHRIVAAIEEHLSRLDAAGTAVRSAIRRLEALRRHVLLSVIPSTLPRNWKPGTVEEAGVVQLGRQRAPRYHTGANMRPYLRVANVFEDRLDLRDVMEMDFSDADFARYRLEAGNILLNEGQSPELVGRPAMYRGEPPNVCFTNSLIRFRPGEDVDGEFALLVFRRHLHAGRFQREARITTNIAHLSAGRLKSVEFPRPPIDEQRRIVESVHRQLTLLGALGKQARTALRSRETLRRAILASAFRGELVAQDPNDEPAGVLLERIAAERAATPKPTRKRREKASA